jgi:RHS repeat-associated protein
MPTVRYESLEGEIIAEKRSGVRRVYSPDPLGTTQALLDGGQTQTDTFRYWPYGAERSRTGSTPTPFRFVGAYGYYRDSGGRAYVRGRHLSMETGRWMTQDPNGVPFAEPNPYKYALASPTVWVDPTGASPRTTPPVRGPGWPFRRHIWNPRTQTDDCLPYWPEYEEICRAKCSEWGGYQYCHVIQRWLQKPDVDCPCKKPLVDKEKARREAEEELKEYLRRHGYNYMMERPMGRLWLTPRQPPRDVTPIPEWTANIPGALVIGGIILAGGWILWPVAAPILIGGAGAGAGLVPCAR